MPLKVWIQAARLRTLPLALAGAVTGNLLAYTERRACNYTVFTLSVLTAVFLQILSNYANDYGDFRNGADSAERTDRMMASGLISEQKMRIAIGILIALCLISGISLLTFSINSLNNSFWSLFGMGIMSLFAAYFYTAGKNPYGYFGLGDITVFIFFGLLSVAGTYYLQTQTLDSHIWWVASAIGFMSVGVLNINNIRDIETDKFKNKKTIPVRIGSKKALIYQILLLGSAVACFTVYSNYNRKNIIIFNLIIFSALFIFHVRSLQKSRKREDFNKQLKFLSLLSFTISFYYCYMELIAKI